MFKRLFPDLKPLTKYIAQGPKNQFPKTLYQMQILICDKWQHIPTWRFPKIGVPPVIIQIFMGIFHEINKSTSYWGTPIDGNPNMSSSKMDTWIELLNSSTRRPEQQHRSPASHSRRHCGFFPGSGTNTSAWFLWKHTWCLAGYSILQMRVRAHFLD